MGPFPSMVLQTSGNDKLLWKNILVLDYPDLDVESFPIECKYGNFGPAQKEVADSTGIPDYNFTMESTFFCSKGVINEDGTKITTYGISNCMEEWVWMDEKMMEETKANRDPYETPR